LESKEKQTSIFKPFKKKDRKEEIVSLGGTALREAVKEYKVRASAIFQQSDLVTASYFRPSPERH
jgi:hypothetical protein